MDLAKGHVLSLDALAKDVSEGIFKSTDTSKSGYYRAFNLGKGKGMSVLDMINAMKKASGFDFQYKIVGRRCVSLFFLLLPLTPSSSSSLLLHTSLCAWYYHKYRVNSKEQQLTHRLGDVPDLTADPTLAEKELGFVASENLETMCRDLWNFQTKFPSGW
jgi:UDP-glucose 4-epimerase